MKIDQQRGKIVVTLEANDLEADWRGFLTAIRERIPSRHREYRSAEKTWIIKERYIPLVDEIGRRYLTPKRESSAPPVSTLMSLSSPGESQESLTHVLALPASSQESGELMNLPSSRWPFFLLSLSFATIGWWMATTTFPSVWHYLHLRPRTFPLFDGIILCLSTFAGLGSTIYALRLLFQGSSVAPSLPP